jgi:ferredoxin-NADP reductase
MSLARKLRCTVAAITNHGGGVYSVELSPAGFLPSFRPGQFLHLTVEPYDPSGFWPESRVFSIASSPQDKKRLCFCYSVKGRYTTKMEQSLRVGSEVWVKLPYGEFFIDLATDAVLFAGGTGISAFSAFIEALPPDHPKSVWLVYGVRHPDMLLFGEMLRAQIARVPRFQAIFFAEKKSEELVAKMEGSAVCLGGLISLDSLWQHIPEPAGKVFYLAGPPHMQNTLSAGLLQRHITPDNIRTDAWE